MKELVQSYKGLASALVSIALAVEYAVLTYGVPSVQKLLKAHFTPHDWILLIVLSGANWAVIVFWPLQMYEKYLWRYHHPDLDLTGLWDYAVTHDPPDEAMIGHQAAEVARGIIDSWPNRGVVRVVQDVFTLKMQQGKGEPQPGRVLVSTWQANAIDMTGEGTFTVFLSLTVGGRAERYTAVDAVQVDPRASDWRGRPTRVAGTLLLASVAKGVSVSGQIVYTRSMHLSWVERLFNRRSQAPQHAKKAA